MCAGRCAALGRASVSTRGCRPAAMEGPPTCSASRPCCGRGNARITGLRGGGVGVDAQRAIEGLADDRRRRREEEEEEEEKKKEAP